MTKQLPLSTLNAVTLLTLAQQPTEQLVSASYLYNLQCWAVMCFSREVLQGNSLLLLSHSVSDALRCIDNRFRIELAPSESEFNRIGRCREIPTAIIWLRANNGMIYVYVPHLQKYGRTL